MTTPAEVKDAMGRNRVAQGVWTYYDAVKMAGLPVGVQVVGRRLEEKVLGVMQRLEDALETRGERYKLFEGWISSSP
jgi:hypothetical protein